MRVREGRRGGGEGEVVERVLQVIIKGLRRPSVLSAANTKRTIGTLQ